MSTFTNWCLRKGSRFKIHTYTYMNVYVCIYIQYCVYKCIRILVIFVKILLKSNTLTHTHTQTGICSRHWTVISPSNHFIGEKWLAGLPACLPVCTLHSLHMIHHYGMFSGGLAAGLRQGASLQWLWREAWKEGWNFFSWILKKNLASPAFFSKVIHPNFKLFMARLLANSCLFSHPGGCKPDIRSYFSSVVGLH